ncbi:MAG: CpaF family protein, partial [Planctomycetota bacterium]|nr:CpaF family protein [Planctomycetota bacterium]
MTADPHDTIRVLVHQQLLETLDLNRANKLDQPALELECERRVRSMVASMDRKLDPADRDRLVREILDEVFGLGPLQSLMDDEEVSDILVNGPEQVFVER